MKPEYARNLMRMQFFKYAYYYNIVLIDFQVFFASLCDFTYFKGLKFNVAARL